MSALSKRRRKSADAVKKLKPPVTLDRLARGSEARVTGVPTDPRLLRKLMAFGILPGSDLVMLQRTPTFVVRVGFTDVALGREIASLIEVREES